MEKGYLLPPSTAVDGPTDDGGPMAVGRRPRAALGARYSAVRLGHQHDSMLVLVDQHVTGRWNGSPQLDVTDLWSTPRSSSQPTGS